MCFPIHNLVNYSVGEMKRGPHCSAEGLEFLHYSVGELKKGPHCRT